MSPGILDCAEALREVGPVLEGLELRLREGVVVRDMGPAVRLGHAEIGEQERDGLRGHRRAAVGMDRQLIAADLLARARLVDEAFGQRRALAMGTIQPTT